MTVKIKLRGIKEEFAKIDEETKEAVNSLSRLQAFDTMNKIKSRTPIDTGRARNSWNLTTNPVGFRDAKSGGPAPSTLPPISDKKIETLYLTNGTPYIENLNQGSSRQAPARFIESTVLENYSVDGILFETINVGDED